MITSNFIAAWYTPSGNTFFTKTDGTTVQFYGADIIGWGKSLSNTIPAPNNSAYIALGTGATKEARSDINLASPVNNSDFSVLNSTISFADGKIMLAQTYKYNGSSEVTIAEMGWIVTGNKQGVGQPIMLARKVLDSSITINSEHNTFTVSMAIG